MEITWLGHASFRLRGKDATIVCDPTPRKGGSKLTADVVTVSHAHPGHNQTALVGGEPRVFRGPGEYEVKGIHILGVPTFHDAEKGKKRGKNTAYIVDIDDVVVAHLGDLGHVLSSEQAADFRNVDVLLIPVGGVVTIDAAQAAEVISLVEPRIVIPMHYRLKDQESTLETADKFLREMGASDVEPQARFSAVKTTLPEGPQVVLLEAR